MNHPAMHVHRAICRGYGICANLLPERIRLDDWGYPILDPRPVPDELLELAALAVRDCPAAALMLGGPAEDG